MRRVALTFACLLATGSVPASEPFSYRFEQVSSNVTLARGTSELAATAGQLAAPGDVVKTGWRGRAVVQVPERGSRFEIYPSTVAQLASKEPGVLISVNRGKLKALFDKMTGTDERLVRTPGALLAVRGTRYGIEVDSGGRTTLSVFEGRVEIRPFAFEEPLFVSAGQLCYFGPRLRPELHALPAHMNEESWERRSSEIHRERFGPRDGMTDRGPFDGMGGAGATHGGMSGAGSSPAAGQQGAPGASGAQRGSSGGKH
jgi:hypothetical protein